MQGLEDQNGCRRKN